MELQLAENPSPAPNCGLITGMQLCVDDGLAIRTKLGQTQCFISRQSCNRISQYLNCVSWVDLQLGQKKSAPPLQLHARGVVGLATMTKIGCALVASREWTCSWDKKKVTPAPPLHVRGEVATWTKTC